MKKVDLTNVKGWASVSFREEYKTAIIGSKPYYYLIVTRVNYLTAGLWLEDLKQKVGNKIGPLDLPKKPNWLIMYKAFRREIDNKLTPKIT